MYAILVIATQLKIIFGHTFQILPYLGYLNRSVLAAMVFSRLVGNQKVIQVFRGGERKLPDLL